MISVEWMISDSEPLNFAGNDFDTAPSALKSLPLPWPDDAVVGTVYGPGRYLMNVSIDDSNPASVTWLSGVVGAAGAQREVILVGKDLSTPISQWAGASELNQIAASALWQSIPSTGDLRDLLEWLARSNLVYQEVGFPTGSTLSTLMSEVEQSRRTQMSAKMRRFSSNLRPTTSGTVGQFFLNILNSGEASYGIRSGRASWGRREANLGRT